MTDIKQHRELWFTLFGRKFGFEIGFFMFGKPKWFEKKKEVMP